MRGRATLGVETQACEDGPLLVRGADAVWDQDGRRHPVCRPVVALCRCGFSAGQPWCDGMHKLVQQREAEQPEPGPGD